MRMVTTMKAKQSCRKGFVMFAVHISSDKGKEVEDVDSLSRFHLYISSMMYLSCY